MATMTDKDVKGLTIRKIPVESNWERFAYLFMRLSGVAMLVLAVGHMMIQHVINSSTTLSMAFVAEQWSTWGWKLFDTLLLWMAIPHGINGLRNVLIDHLHSPGLVRLLTIVLAVFVVATVLWASFAIAMFDSTAFR